MKIIETIILGIVQGIAEFLPISSSAHLIIFRDVFGIGSFITGSMEMSFDIALHFGTFLAILVYFFKDFWKMFIKGFTKGCKDQNGKMMWMIVVATIPAAIMGVLFEEVISDMILNNYVLIVICLAVMGIIIRYTDKLSKEEKNLKEMTFRDAILIGCAQVCALVPGFSRSGTTILAGRLIGIDKEAITKFTFLLSVPIIAGATVLKVKDLELTKEVIIGVVTSFIVGIICIKFLLKYIKNHDFSIFAFYRVIVAIIIYVKLIWF